MKTQTQVTITEITTEDLVNLFSTALYGSSYLTAGYEESVEYDEDDCHEEIMANILLNGGKVKVTDHYADGCHYGRLPWRYEEDYEVTYEVGLEDIKRGLERAASGTFDAGNDEWTEQELRSARISFESFANEDSVDFDLVRADILMQIILFDKTIYG